MRGGALALAAAAAVALCACRSAAPVDPEAPASVAVAATPAAAPPASPAASPEVSPAASPTAPYRNTVRWSTASEVDNFGYDVYRGTAEDGPFERLTRDPIAGAGTTDEPHKYSFVDDAIDPHTTYYYYVESISLSGDRERFTPVILAKPKLPPS